MMDLPENWVEREDKLFLEVKSSSFAGALALLNTVGEVAEKLNHHPDLMIRNYNELQIAITTHDAGGLTNKDFELAQEISNIMKDQSEKYSIIYNDNK